MKEDLLQAIWQFSLYQPAGLCTTAGEPVTVVHPGTLNRDSGPDFSGARIRIGDTLLAGAVEMHLRSSDWKRHLHSADEAYKSVVLHVVLEDDLPGAAAGVPVLVLAPHISAAVATRYASLVDAAIALPCADQHGQVAEIVKSSWLIRMLSQRWERRFTGYEARLTDLHGDFGALLYESLAAGMGFKVNADAFGRLARQTPLALLLKNRERLHALEALLFGQSGLLPVEGGGAYIQSLRSEYQYLRHKYGLQPLAAHEWKFLRMRPANFPTIRLAQFASLIHHLGERLTALLDVADAQEAVAHMQVPLSDFWHTHTTFKEGQTHAPQEKTLGKSSAETLVANVLAPLKYLRAVHSGNRAEREKAEAFLDSLPPEKNSLVARFAGSGWKPRNATEAQGMLELYQFYCSAKNCLNCSVGLRILRGAAVK